MSTKKKAPPPLREQIIAFLKGREEATLKQIAAATSEHDYPSRVTSELNKMRTDTLIECAKKKGKNELWYWLATAQADQSGNTQPAVVENTGSSASALPSLSAEGATVQPETAPEAAAPLSAAPVAEDDTAEALRDALVELAFVREHLAELIGGEIDPIEMSESEIARAAAQVINAHDDELIAQAKTIIDLRNQLGEERSARLALQEQVESMASQTLTSIDPAGFLVRAPKRPLRTFSKAEAARAAAMAATRNGSGRGEVFALVPAGKAVRGAEWRPAQ
jgi:hypothetical protein